MLDMEGMKMNSKKILISEISAILFVLLIILVRTVDVAPIGPAGTAIGLSGINGAVAKALGFHNFLYKLTDLLGYLALLMGGLLALKGLKQLIERKKLFAVDANILISGVLYAVTIALYFFFDKVAVNFRPVLMEGELVPEASFPSSHTVLACVMFASHFILAEDLVRDDGLRKKVRIVLAALLGITVLGRFFSGAHWFTDIIAGLLLSTSLISLYSAALDLPGSSYKPKH